MSIHFQKKPIGETILPKKLARGVGELCEEFKPGSPWWLDTHFFRVLLSG